MTEQSQLDAQLAQIRADVLSGKLSRRAALKAIGAAAAMATLAARGVSVSAQDASPAAGGGADEVPQIFYQRGYTDESDLVRLQCRSVLQRRHERVRRCHHLRCRFESGAGLGRDLGVQ